MKCKKQVETRRALRLKVMNNMKSNKRAREAEDNVKEYAKTKEKTAYKKRLKKSIDLKK